MRQLLTIFTDPSFHVTPGFWSTVDRRLNSSADGKHGLLVFLGCTSIGAHIIHQGAEYASKGSLTILYGYVHIVAYVRTNIWVGLVDWWNDETVSRSIEWVFVGYVLICVGLVWSGWSVDFFRFGSACHYWYVCIYIYTYVRVIRLVGL